MDDFGFSDRLLAVANYGSDDVSVLINITEILRRVVAGPGPAYENAPLVRVFQPEQDATHEYEFPAYGPTHYGVNVTCGNVDSSIEDEIFTGAGPGAVYGPHVRGWDVDGGTFTAIRRVSFLAYGTNKFGVNVTCGDIDGDGIDEIVTGPGPGAVFGAHVRGWNYDGVALESIPGINFFAWPYAEARFGARVYAGADLDGDGRDELVVGCGRDPNVGTPVKVYMYDGMEVTQWFSLEAFPGLMQGTSVAGGRF